MSATAASPADDDPPPRATHPLVPSDPPFRDLVELRTDPGQELQREVRLSAARRLALLEQLHQEILREARTIAAETRGSLLLHDVATYGRKVRGRVYHLYRRVERAVPVWLSFLTPGEQQQADPRAEWLGSYLLRADGSWEETAGLSLEELTELPELRPEEAR